MNNDQQVLIKYDSLARRLMDTEILMTIRPGKGTLLLSHPTMWQGQVHEFPTLDAVEMFVNGLGKDLEPTWQESQEI